MSSGGVQPKRKDPEATGRAEPAQGASLSSRGPSAATRTFWRVEGSLLDLSAVRPVAYFTWNAQSFSERWARRSGVAALALVRPVIYAGHRVGATRVLHALLRGISRDRLDLLGEEYFHYVLKPQLKPKGVACLRRWMDEHGPVVLVSQALGHVMRPLAEDLGVQELVANRLEFRDGRATGRLREPVIRPRGPLALITSRRADGRVSAEQLARDLNFKDGTAALESAIRPTRRPAPQNHRAIVLGDHVKKQEPFSVPETLRGKHILLVGVTGFIGKVWLANLLSDVPEIGKIFLLIRKQKGASAQRRFEKIVEESPVFDPLHERLGGDLPKFLSARIEVVEGDVSQPGLGLDAKTRTRLERTLDLLVNSAGLVDFNPDLRDALATNVRGVAHLLHFLRASDHAGLVHISTCYVAGARNGRITEELQADYTPAHEGDFDAEHEWKSLEELIRKVEERSESAEVAAAIRRQLLGRRGEKAQLTEAELEIQIRRSRARWVRNRLIRAGTRRARHLGWPNTYTFTKSLAESLITRRAADLPVAIVRPSIVESSTDQPFPGWNEGINTSAPLSYLLGTFFRQLPTNERKCLDIIPVDMVCRGLTLIGAAVIARRHERLYQLATSTANPCDMGRSIELTALAHRKHYRAQQGLEHWLRLRFETIPVSKSRYRKFSVPAQKAVVSGINRITSQLLRRAPLARQERDLARVEKLIELYEPFILHNEQVFEAQNVQLLSAALPEDEKQLFGYEAGSIDWWDYWINVHVPALRKWVYPLIEGRPLEPRERRAFQLGEPSGTPATDAIPGTPSHAKATWPSS
jgi:thioester reductase-like protein